MTNLRMMLYAVGVLTLLVLDFHDDRCDADALIRGGEAMILIAVRCPYCYSDQIIKRVRLIPTTNAIGAKTSPAPINPSSSTQPIKGACPPSSSR
jgi:hypothetical protein